MGEKKEILEQLVKIGEKLEKSTNDFHKTAEEITERKEAIIKSELDADMGRLTSKLAEVRGKVDSIIKRDEPRISPNPNNVSVIADNELEEVKLAKTAIEFENEARMNAQKAALDAARREVELNEAIRNAREMELQAINKTLSELSKQKESLVKKQDELSYDETKINNVLAELETLITSKITQKEKVNAIANDLKNTVQELEDEVAKLEASIIPVREKRNRAQNDFHEHKDAFIQLEGDISEIHVEIQKATDELEIARRALKSIKDGIYKIDTKEAELEEAAKELEHHILTNYSK